jgi:hypothetical protein
LNLWQDFLRYNFKSKKFNIMVKGHNKGRPPQKENKGGSEHLKHKKKHKISAERQGRHKEDDQSGGTKGSNSI